MWFISPRDFNHICVINGSPGIGPHMMVSLQGTADLLVRHLKPEDVAGDDGKIPIYTRSSRAVPS